ncbi:MAG: GTP pyrophosphokinase family protein [Lachnospiraceae bacterium]|nr:GTP pyrophosphokinase family protein [Lachnospiraceae bacterium]
MGLMKEEYQEFLNQMGEESFLNPYRDVCRKMEQKLEKINIDYSEKLGRTFISQITYRIKTPESCLNKIVKKKYPVNRRTAREYLGDIAGMRVICSFLDDIYKLAEIIKADKELKVIKTKDYVKKPKASGYQSLHMIVEIPSAEGERRKIEIQIRTQAMNFWAVVEHHFVYKKGEYEKDAFEKDLKECARTIYKIDKKMLLIRKKMETAKKNEKN